MHLLWRMRFAAYPDDLLNEIEQTVNSALI